MIEEFATWAVEMAASWGYLGIFALMFIESSLVPFPSEVVMIPAGMAASEGKLALLPSILAGTAGSLAGAYFNYYLAVVLGRPVLLKYGRYFFLPPAKFERACAFFDRHGAFGTFLCRLLPGIRQIVSIPAGLARMPHWSFASCTTAGAGLWVAFLAGAGYVVGNNREAAMGMVKSSIPYILVGALVLIAGYVVILRRRAGRAEAGGAGVEGVVEGVGGGPQEG